jgi:uncharacterized protein YndB with AHSA1/START domain
MTEATEVFELHLERVIPASRERVFAAWTQPELLARWSAPEGLTIPEGELDLRVGGRWRVLMVQPDGTRHEAFGVYRVIDPPARLVYSHQWVIGDGPDASPETELTVEFHDEGEGTRVVLRQTGFEAEGARDSHGEGWTSALGNLVALFEQGGALSLPDAP